MRKEDIRQGPRGFRAISEDRLRVERNTNPLVLGGSGFYVVEHTPDGHDIPRGWTYPSEAEALLALPLVAAGDWYPEGGVNA